MLLWSRYCSMFWKDQLPVWFLSIIWNGIKDYLFVCTLELFKNNILSAVWSVQLQLHGLVSSQCLSILNIPWWNSATYFVPRWYMIRHGLLKDSAWSDFWRHFIFYSAGLQSLSTEYQILSKKSNCKLLALHVTQATACNHRGYPLAMTVDQCYW